MGLWISVLKGLRLALVTLTQTMGGSLGLGIISLSIVVRIALLPWVMRAAHRSRVMRERIVEMQPRLAALRKRYAQEPRKLGEAFAREYRAAGVRPIKDSGLGVLVVQIVVGLALYSVISQGLGGSNPFLWISDLALPDVGLAFVAALGSFLLTVVQPSLGDTGPNPLVIGLVMAAGTLLIATKVAAGVGLYWTASTGMGLVQSLLLRRASREPGRS